MVNVHQLVKTYGKTGKVLAVDEVSFSVEKGEIFGLIGPDGAGKTSLFRMLATLLLPDGGNGTINGLDIVGDYKQIRNILGYVPGRFSLYPDLSIEENLRFFASLFNTTVAENYHLIEDIYIQLERFKKRRAGQLSGGMKQKLALCCALIHKPVVLLLDEPTTGVDPVSRKEFWAILKNLKQQGITIVVSTPYMDEAVLCDRIALMQKGILLSIDTPENIIQAYPDQLFAVKSANMHQLLKAIAGYDGKASGYAFGEYAHISFKEASITEERILDYFRDKGFGQVDIHRTSPTIEDCFIKLLSD